MNLEDHPTVRRLSRQVQEREIREPAQTVLNGAWLRRLALDFGADDAGLVEIARPGLAAQRDEILRNYPWTRSLLSFVLRMAREPVRGPPRSVANLEFHRAGHRVDEIGAEIVAKLEARGVRAVNPSMGFPMEMYQTPGHGIWVRRRRHLRARASASAGPRLPDRAAATKARRRHPENLRRAAQRRPRRTHPPYAGPRGRRQTQTHDHEDAAISLRLRNQPRHSIHEQWLRTRVAPLRRVPQDHQWIPHRVGGQALCRHPLRHRNRAPPLHRSPRSNPSYPRRSAPGSVNIADGR